MKQTVDGFGPFPSSVNRSSWYPWPTLARSEGLRGGQLRALNRLRAEALGDLAVGIDASLSGQLDGPVWSVSDRGTAGALD